MLKPVLNSAGGRNIASPKKPAFLFWHTLICSFLISTHGFSSACLEITAISKNIARRKAKDWSVVCNFGVAVCACRGLEVFPES